MAAGCGNPEGEAISGYFGEVRKVMTPLYEVESKTAKTSLEAGRLAEALELWEAQARTAARVVKELRALSIPPTAEALHDEVLRRASLSKDLAEGTVELILYWKEQRREAEAGDETVRGKIAAAVGENEKKAEGIREAEEAIKQLQRNLSLRHRIKLPEEGAPSPGN